MGQAGAMETERKAPSSPTLLVNETLYHLLCLWVKGSFLAGFSLTQPRKCAFSVGDVSRGRLEETERHDATQQKQGILIILTPYNITPPKGNSPIAREGDAKKPTKDISYRKRPCAASLKEPLPTSGPRGNSHLR